MGAAAAGGGFAAADACLGIPGLPQSGTGQTTLLTGVNGAALLGRHFGPWVPTGLRELLAAENLLSRGRAAGHRVAFANAYPSAYLAAAGDGALRRPAAPPLAAWAAGALVRDERALREGSAVASEIDHTAWRARLDPELPAIEAADAGRNLARIAAEAHLTLFAHYATDTAGHRGDHAGAVAALERVDRFLSGLLIELPADCLLVIASDHGNIEEVGAGHTTNPVPVITRGPGAGELVREIRSIADLVPKLLALLDVP